MAYTNGNILKSIDWICVILFLLLMAFGWISVCGASYDYGNINFFSLDSRAGKQLLWMGCAIIVAFVTMMLDHKIYDTFAYLIYTVMMLLLFVTPFIAEDTKGSYSWIKLGAVSIQPAEFAKFATALALAKWMNTYGYTMQKMKYLLPTLCLFLLPVILIILQHETGSALVYLSFFFVLYREGMHGSILFAGICAIIYFVVGIRFDEVMLPDGQTSVGSFTVLCFILTVVCIMLHRYDTRRKMQRVIESICLVGTIAALLVSHFLIAFDVSIYLYAVCIGIGFYLILSSLRTHMKHYFYIALFSLLSAGFLFSTDYVFDRLLEPHQQTRIKVVLGMEEDLSGAGYNVNQSKIAIGSGGLWGKGFLNGTQTKLKYVPEQDTDFIFCTVGEEEGFVGAVAVLLLFLALILRIMVLAEREHSVFGRVYGYSVASIFFFHLFINIGMVIGLTPVIGIPLPFFSYGGSSLWGFTLLLFIFLRIHAGNRAT